MKIVWGKAQAVCMMPDHVPSYHSMGHCHEVGWSYFMTTITQKCISESWYWDFEVSDGKFSTDCFIMWTAVHKWGSPSTSFWSCLDGFTTCYTIFKQCQNAIHTGYSHSNIRFYRSARQYGYGVTLPNTTSGFQFCVPRMNIRTADHNEAYLNKTDYHTVKHHSCRNCNILYIVKPNDVIRTVSEESKHVRRYCVHKCVLHNKKLQLPFPSPLHLHVIYFKAILYIFITYWIWVL
jgi:hypothetical protein